MKDIPLLFISNFHIIYTWRFRDHRDGNLVVPVQVGSLEVVMDFRHYFVRLQIYTFQTNSKKFQLLYNYKPAMRLM